MFKKVVKYENFEGEMKAKTLYFNISKTEILKMRTDDRQFNLISSFKGLADSFTIEKAIGLIDMMIDLSYGERSEDGETFRKSPDLLAKFKESAAYDALFDDLCNTEGAIKEFFTKVFPKEVIESASKVAENVESDPILNDYKTRMEETASTNLGV